MIKIIIRNAHRLCTPVPHRYQYGWTTIVLPVVTVDYIVPTVVTVLTVVIVVIASYSMYSIRTIYFVLCMGLI